MNGTLWFLAEVMVYGLIWSYLLGLVPAFVISALKDNWVLVMAGFITFGITWFVGATRQAEPDSWWAGRCYPQGSGSGSTEMPEFRKGRRRRGLAIAASAIVLVGVLAARPSLVIGTDADSLQRSVGGFVSFERACLPRSDETWTCFAYDYGLSAEAAYRTDVDRAGCWTARSVHTGRLAPAEKELSGCVTAFDHVRPFSRILG